MAETLADAIAAIATDVGRTVLARWGNGVRHWEKGPGDPVSEADLEADRLLHARLTALLPDAGWLSEETIDNPERLTRRRLWVVDPIDGTRDFVRGRDGWAVSIALVEDGQPLVGILDAPARGQHWRAEAGRGATLNGVPIHVSGRTALSGARVPADTLPAIDSDLVPVPRANSIALRMAMVASGEADLLATLRWGAEWDVAAAVLIVTEAGGTVTDALGAPVRFNTTNANLFGVLATTPAIHTAAVDRLAERAKAANAAQSGRNV